MAERGGTSRKRPQNARHAKHRANPVSSTVFLYFHCIIFRPPVEVALLWRFADCRSRLLRHSFPPGAVAVAVASAPRAAPHLLPAASLPELRDEGRFHRQALLILHDPVDEPVLHGLVRLEVLDALAVLLHDVDGLLGRRRQELAHGPAVGSDLPGLDGDVGRLTPRHGLGLVQQDGRVGECGPPPPLPLGQEHGGGAERLPEGDGVHGGSDVLHHVGDGKRLSLEAYRLTGGGRGAGRVDVHGDGIGGRLVVQVQELGDDKLGDGGNQGHADVNDAVVQQKRREVRGRADTNAWRGSGFGNGERRWK